MNGAAGEFGKKRPAFSIRPVTVVSASIASSASATKRTGEREARSARNTASRGDQYTSNHAIKKKGGISPKLNSDGAVPSIISTIVVPPNPKQKYDATSECSHEHRGTRPRQARNAAMAHNECAK